MKEPKKATSVLLPLPIYERLSQLAEESHRSVPGYIRQIIRSYLRYLDEGKSMEEDWYPVIR